MSGSSGGNGLALMNEEQMKTYRKLLTEYFDDELMDCQRYLKGKNTPIAKQRLEAVNQEIINRGL